MVSSLQFLNHSSGVWWFPAQPLPPGHNSSPLLSKTPSPSLGLFPPPSPASAFSASAFQTYHSPVRVPDLSTVILVRGTERKTQTESIAQLWLLVGQGLEPGNGESQAQKSFADPLCRFPSLVPCLCYLFCFPSASMLIAVAYCQHWIHALEWWPSFSFFFSFLFCFSWIG